MPTPTVGPGAEVPQGGDPRLSMSKLENPADLKTFWCLYLGCTGVGLSALGAQLCNSQQKLLCLAHDSELNLTELMGPNGLCLDNSKCLCIQSGNQIIPTKPFIEFCGMRVCGAAKPSGMFRSFSGCFHEILIMCISEPRRSRDRWHSQRTGIR